MSLTHSRASRSLRAQSLRRGAQSGAHMYAAASNGCPLRQVHFATRKGKQLAIKVRHPRVAEQIANDFRLMNLLVEVIDRAIPALRCAALIASSRLSLRT